MVITGITLPIVVLVTGIWSPHRWGMYFDAWRQTVPVSFYGQIVDDRGNPLEGVNVEVHVTTANPWFILGARRFAQDKVRAFRTGGDGRFQVTNQKGWSVGVRNIKKPGYQFTPRVTKGGNWQTTFYFAGGGVGKDGPHKPDPHNPVAFEMRKIE
jgi:hypothetical protein